MSNRYSQIALSDVGQRFSNAVTGELEFSHIEPVGNVWTTFNAGDIVPVFHMEVLPHQAVGIDTNFIIRQTTLLTPTMGEMQVDLHAFFVPNRVVNKSWKSVMGENVNGSWTAVPVSVAPLYDPTKVSTEISSIQIPIGSIADYYGFPTQQPIPTAVLALCNDLKFRGYIEIYNEYFRDQNYQPPIPYSKLNVYEDFLHTNSGEYILGMNANLSGSSYPNNDGGNNSYGDGALEQAIYGNLQPQTATTLRVTNAVTGSYTSRFYAIDKPLKANKLHDYFTSVLPSPQKSSPVLIPVSGRIPVTTGSIDNYETPGNTNAPNLRWRTQTGTPISIGSHAIRAGFNFNSGLSSNTNVGASLASDNDTVVIPSNLQALVQNGEVTLSINDLRMASAMQQVYETLAMCGSRYREMTKAFFGLDVEDPYKDIPTHLGYLKRSLDLFQTAQTAPSESGSTPQGNLAAFGYTANGGILFKPFVALEHGYIHVVAVVRHRNVYSSFLSRDNFRLNMMDWYFPQLANISAQPVYTREINPFVSDSSQVFGYQEAWAEYRYVPDRVSGYMRPGVNQSLALWNYADDFNSSLTIATGNWLKSNSQEVLDRTLAVTSSVAHQFKAQFSFKLSNTLPMPTYSLPGMDVI